METRIPPQSHIPQGGAEAFQNLQPDPSWAFANLTQRETNYATHGYHRYPAKFIPQLAARLIQELSCEGEWVLDPFMGSGTALVEAKRLRRPSIGVDINPVAYWVAQAKVNAIEPERLKRAILQVLTAVPGSQPDLFGSQPQDAVEEFHERLRYWFPPQSLRALRAIHEAIEGLPADDLKVFFRCALSHCLKPLSYWHDRSVKPTRKLSRRIPDARRVFATHVKRMERGNREFWEILTANHALEVPALPSCADARALPAEENTVSLVVTSPPYVTSYEYADLHQLSVLWFGATTDLRSFRKGFIGRSNGIESCPQLMGSPLAERIIQQLGERNPRKASECALYFAEMYQCFTEMRRVLKQGGAVAIVIGNTHISGVEIQNAQVFAEQMATLGFALERVILREIPSKILPRTRDSKTGKFARVDEADYVAYPTEYILILRKR